MWKNNGLSGSTLKILAVISMLIDHTAAVLLSSILTGDAFYKVNWIMRYFIGRFAFPIYCFLLIEGFQRTGSRKKYAVRLFLFALLSEIPFDLAFHGKIWSMEGQNVFFTLGLGMLMMAGMEWVERKCNNIWAVHIGRGLIFLVTAGISELIFCDYGAHGIIAIALLYLFRRNKTEQLIAGCVAFAWEVTAPIAFLPIAFYNGKRGLNLKYAFYAFYPIHLLLLYGIGRCFLWNSYI